MNYRNWSLDDWVKMFEEIYGEKNKGKTDEEIWLHVVEEVAELAEDLRKQHVRPRYNKKGELEGAVINIADTFAWLCAFVSKRGSLEEIVWHKYPNICSYCFVDTNCLCIAKMSYMDKEEREKKLETYRRKKDRPVTLFDWQKMFERIYGNVNRVVTLEQIGFHLMEEVGEVAREIRLRHEQELKDELADVFAWIVGITIKSGELIGEELRLDDIIWERYPNKCPHCQSKPCIDKIYPTGPRLDIS